MKTRTIFFNIKERRNVTDSFLKGTFTTLRVPHSYVVECSRKRDKPRGISDLQRDMIESTDDECTLYAVENYSSTHTSDWSWDKNVKRGITQLPNSHVCVELVWLNRLHTNRSGVWRPSEGRCKSNEDKRTMLSLLTLPRTSNDTRIVFSRVLSKPPKHGHDSMFIRVTDKIAFLPTIQSRSLFFFCPTTVRIPLFVCVFPLFFAVKRRSRRSKSGKYALQWCSFKSRKRIGVNENKLFIIWRKKTKPINNVTS